VAASGAVFVGSRAASVLALSFERDREQCRLERGAKDLPDGDHLRVAGIVMFILVITIPFGVQAFKLAGFTSGPSPNPRPPIGANRVLSVMGNVIWFVLAGIWIAIGHVISAVLCAITSGFRSQSRT
jgi:hypothetical protein